MNWLDFERRGFKFKVATKSDIKNSGKKMKGKTAVREERRGRREEGEKEGEGKERDDPPTYLAMLAALCLRVGFLCTARHCYRKSSVRPSVCDVDVSWA